MKFKMSENSLFAVLLRAPWWISFVVMLVFALAASALLPREYVPFGVMGAFPFLVIGCIAAWRQWHAPSTVALEQMLASICNMPWRDFADTVEKACQAKGYTMVRLNGQAADFRLEKAGKNHTAERQTMESRQSRGRCLTGFGGCHAVARHQLGHVHQLGTFVASRAATGQNRGRCPAVGRCTGAVVAHLKCPAGGASSRPSLYQSKTKLQRYR
jgi:hypothetical protein